MSLGKDGPTSEIEKVAHEIVDFIRQSHAAPGWVFVALTTTGLLIGSISGVAGFTLLLIAAAVTAAAIIITQSRPRPPDDTTPPV